DPGPRRPAFAREHPRQPQDQHQPRSPTGNVWHAQPESPCTLHDEGPEGSVCHALAEEVAARGPISVVDDGVERELHSDACVPEAQRKVGVLVRYQRFIEAADTLPDVSSHSEITGREQWEQSME